MSDFLAPGTKDELREVMRGALRRTTEAHRASGSRAIEGCLTASENWVLRGGAVALFGGLKNEPDLRPIMKWLSTKSIPMAIFAIEGDSLVPFEIVSEADVLAGAMGVWEPNRKTCRRIELEHLGTILVPGLAFGRDGSRLGRGKGYYDRVLNHPMCRARRIGVGWALQLMDSVPNGPQDARMHAYVSEAGWMDISTSRQLHYPGEVEGPGSGFAVEAAAFLARLFW